MIRRREPSSGAPASGGASSGGAPGWLQATARTIRNSPRLLAATDRTFGAVQGNRTLVDIATRVFAWDGAVPVVFLHAGRPLRGMAEVERLPIIVIDAVLLDAARVAHVLREVSILQERTRGFRPVFLLSVPEFAAVRAYGYPVELVVPAADWDFERPWPEYVAERLAMMLARYRAWTIVGVQDDGTLEPGGRRLLEVLETYRPWEARTI
ncbi:MAG: hypothetical protein V9G19_00380 [Tetrasphaera sp.]